MALDIYYTVECGKDSLVTNDRKQALKFYKKYKRKGRKPVAMVTYVTENGYTEHIIKEGWDDKI